jgi:hypothetical protein
MPHDAGPIRITTASSSRNEEIAARQRRYLLSMSLRTVCFVLAVVTEGWVRWVMVAGALILPYVAVVMANAVATKPDGFALTEVPSGRPELPEGSGSGAIGRSDSI